MAKRPKISIHTIAEEAGVSPSTVSRILTGNARVNQDKRKKIEAAISKYNYTPNYARGALVSAARKTLGIILPDITHPYYGEVFVGAETMAIEKGYGILLGNTLNDRLASGHEMENMLIDLMLERQVTGLMLLGGTLDDHDISDEKKKRFRDINANTPLITPGIETSLWGGSTVYTPSSDTIKKAVHYLVSLKHRHFGFLGGEQDVNPSEIRRRALVDVIEELDLPHHGEWFVYSGFGMEDGVTAMERLLQNRECPTALVCVNDLVAIGAMHSAHKHGLRIPDDISIIGCDNIPLCNYVSPALTTIDLRAREEGRIAAEILIDSIEGRGKRQSRILQSELVIRGSCHRAPE